MKTSTADSKTRLYNIWVNMRQRCSNPNWSHYHRYGGRGISVCDKWQSFKVFKQWALKNNYNKNLSIDRIDNDKGYFPENCKWSTPTEQARNTCSNRIITYKGQSKNLSEWSEISGLSCATISKRIEAEWSLKEVFETPLNASPKHLITYNNKSKSIKEWAKYFNININTLRSRLKNWPVEKAFNQKVETKYRSN